MRYNDLDGPRGVRGLHLGGASRFFWRPPWPLSPDSAPTLAYGVCDDDWTALAGLGVVARLTRFLGLPEKLAASVRLQRRRRGGSDVQRLLALLYAACAGGGHLHAVDALGTDDVVRQACGLRAGPASRRLGADLQRMHAAALEGLRLVPPGAQRLRCGRRPAQGACGGAQVARRQDEGPAPGTPGSPLKPYGPLNRHFGKLTGNLGYEI